MALALRILHLSHAGLPDERVERSAWSSRSAGKEVHFAGPKSRGLSLPADPFASKSVLDFGLRSNLGEPFSSSRLVKRAKQIVAQVKPDLVHAHDIFAGRLATRLGVPFVYDDHEYWSKAVLANSGMVDPVSAYKSFLWGSWEEDVLSQAQSVITVSESIAEEHRKRSHRVFTVPNFPRTVEIRDLSLPELGKGEMASVYTGSCTPPFMRFRDTEGLTDLFRRMSIGTLKVIGDDLLRTNPPVFSLGRLSHGAMMREISKCQIGLIPWKKHWFHRYCNPNKAYEYAHAGCVVIVISTLEQVCRTLSNLCVAFEDYGEMASVMIDMASRPDDLVEKGKTIQAFARGNLVWDRFDSTINEAYREQ